MVLFGCVFVTFLYLYLGLIYFSLYVFPFGKFSASTFNISNFLVQVFHLILKLFYFSFISNCNIFNDKYPAE